ncbi:hypothetical protein K488DRAFT_74027 [Vararia minispora EC-137]|uniref:Uncharacterized protein n=1 Tax=Vararia minispora EC-137 TaxID=1314806 RepID=A0ACB8Q8Q2_9AGAM|nr:hypothetical protein K488DRAFT_74027 [Vararia minispora EC-137]
MPFLPFASSGLSSPYGVLDRYDLFPGAPVFDYASDAGADSLSVSAFSDPDGMGMGLGLGRGFTHHSRTAGDLIFGARTHQPAGADYGPGFGFGVGLDMGMSAMHASGLPGIDEIELSAITLNEPSDDVAEPSPAPPQTPPQTAPLTPEEPHTSRRTSAPHAPASTSRSLSVPPPEHRLIAPADYVALTPTRSLSLDLQHPSGPATANLHGLLLGMDAMEFRSAPGDVPFLDLHYYPSSSPSASDAAAHLESARQGLALDLAQVQAHRGFASLGAEAEKLVRGRSAGHVRGVSQGVVRPQDLVAPSSSATGGRKENKRKRASWDGAR